MTTLGSMVVEQSARIHGINEELRRLNADLDAFAYAASHDLKEPLRGVHHHLFMLEKADGLTGPTFDHGMNSLKRLTSRMGELLDGLLRFSRAGRQELNWETLSLSELVDQARDVVFGGLPPTNVKVSVGKEADVVGDFACIREILSNLISNANKYNQQEICEIEIGVTHVAQTPLKRYTEFGNNTIYVKDNGIGVPVESQDKIFEIFTRMHGHNEYGGGSGAGLTIVRRMVERHGGKITIESDGKTGSTFYFGWEAK
jgi:light-regulated signal transduction histidine kinase (bacteriophytochrome)